MKRHAPILRVILRTRLARELHDGEHQQAIDAVMASGKAADMVLDELRKRRPTGSLIDVLRGIDWASLIQAILAVLPLILPLFTEEAPDAEG